MNTLSTIALTALIAYSIIGTYSYKKDQLPPGLKIIAGFTIWRTQRGIDLLDRLATRAPTFWTYWGTAGAILAYITLFASALLVLSSTTYVTLNPQPDSPISNPANALVIPGVNELLPWSVAGDIFLGLLIGLVIHEAGHGILCRIGDINIKSVGTLSLAVLPIGAFVEPDEDSVTATTASSRIKMYAAGVMNNFAISAVILLVLLGPVMGSIAVAPGASVADTRIDSPAATAGIEKGDRITAVNNTPITTNADFQNLTERTHANTLELTTADGTTQTVTPSVTVIQSTKQSPFTPGTVLTAVNNTPITTTSEFHSLAQNTTYATLSSENTTATIPLGALVYPQENTPAGQVLPTDRAVTITHIDDVRTINRNALQTTLQEYAPGDTITITTASNNTTNTSTVTLTERDDNAYLGVLIASGVSGMYTDDTGISLYPAQTYLDVITSGFDDGNSVRTSPLGHFFGLLQLPAAGINGVLPYNFAGFVDGIENFYTVTGPLTPLGTSTVLSAATLLFWVAWVNINLGIFNCIPAYPLDGGHLTNSALKSTLSRVSTTDRATTLAKHITVISSLVMWSALAILLFGPRYLL